MTSAAVAFYGTIDSIKPYFKYNTKPYVYMNIDLYIDDKEFVALAIPASFWKYKNEKRIFRRDFLIQLSNLCDVDLKNEDIVIIISTPEYIEALLPKLGYNNRFKFAGAKTFKIHWKKIYNSLKNYMEYFLALPIRVQKLSKHIDKDLSYFIKENK